MENTEYLQNYGKWMAPAQDCNITAVEDVPLADVLDMFGPANQVGVKNPHTKAPLPVQYLRQVIHIEDIRRKRAELAITAHGLYEVYVNGKAITDTRLNPGFTAYNAFLEYQTYDVTEYLQTGENCIAIRLADGWYKGKYGLMAFGGNYGKQTAVIFCLKVEQESGEIIYIGSDNSMVSSTGPEEYSDFLEGEVYDARKEQPGWKEAAFDDSHWNACHEDVDTSCKNLQPESAEPVREVETIPVKQIITTPKGETVLDFGVNIAGYVEMKVHGNAGDVIRLDHFEVLDKDGNYYNSIFGYNRSQTVIYTCKGDGTEVYHPTFTFFGFRYVKVSGYQGELKAEDFCAKVLSTDLQETGTFTCSSSELNRLQSSIVRSQKSNFISIPTDCPQRERAGWTGDVLVYSDTALFNQNVEKFFERWLKSVDAEQLSNGEIPIVVPYVNGYQYFQKPLMGADSSSGWGDVIIHLPWNLYQEYGKEALLREQFPYMKKWMDYVEKQAENKGSEQEDDKYLWNTGFHFGDWLYPSSKDENGNTEMMDGDFCTTGITATVFYALDTQVMSQVCEILGKAELNRHYTELNQKIKKAFRKAYTLPGGKMTVDLQGMYVLALAGNMLEEKQAAETAARLNELIKENGYCLDTGFMSIRYLMDVLQKYGYAETACKILYQTKCPSWLYEIGHDATTVWETWDAIRPDGITTPVSYNHYAFGCVGEWMYRELLGLKRLVPGWKEFEVSPSFDFGLTHAEGSHMVNGHNIQFRWTKEAGNVRYKLHVPDGLTAIVPLDGAQSGSVSVNGKEPEKSATGKTKLRLAPGDYEVAYVSAS